MGIPVNTSRSAEHEKEKDRGWRTYSVRKQWTIGLTTIGVAAILVFGVWFPLAGYYTPKPGSVGGTGGGGTSVYGITVFNLASGKNLTSANITYYTAKTNGLPDEALASGTMDNVSMIDYAFPAGTIWASVQLAGYETNWVTLAKHAMNSISMLKIPTANATVSTLNDATGTAIHLTNATGNMDWTFAYTAQNGTGLREQYIAGTNTTLHVTLVFTFNTTAVKSYVTVDSQVTSLVTINADVLTIPTTSSFIVPATATTPALMNSVTINRPLLHGSVVGISTVKLEYNGVVYGTFTPVSAPA